MHGTGVQPGTGAPGEFPGGDLLWLVALQEKVLSGGNEVVFLIDQLGVLVFDRL